MSKPEPSAPAPKTEIENVRDNRVVIELSKTPGEQALSLPGKASLVVDAEVAKHPAVAALAAAKHIRLRPAA